MRYGDLDVIDLLAAIPYSCKVALLIWRFLVEGNIQILVRES